MAVFCTSCGEAAADGARYCGSCGATIAPAPVTAESAPAPMTRATGGPASAAFAPSASRARPQTAASFTIGALHVALGAGALSVIAGIVSFALVMAGSLGSQEQADALLWVWGGIALAFVAIAWAVHARTSRYGRPITRQNDVTILGLLAAVTVLLTIIGFAFGLHYDVVRQIQDQDSLFVFFSSAREAVLMNLGIVAALLTLGWAVLSRPLEARRTKTMATIATVLGLLLVGIGLIVGEQSGNTDGINPYVHGSALITSGVALVVLAAAALLGERE